MITTVWVDSIYTQIGVTLLTILLCTCSSLIFIDLSFLFAQLFFNTSIMSIDNTLGMPIKESVIYVGEGVGIDPELGNSFYCTNKNDNKCFIEEVEYRTILL